MKELTLPQVAKIHNRSAGAVQGWVRSGLLKARLIGGMYLVRESDAAKIVVPRRGPKKSRKNCVAISND